MGQPKKNFYAVARGRTTGLFTGWSVCEESIHKFPNAVHKGFTNIDQTIHFLLANKVYSSCCDMPIYVDREISNSVRDYEHECTHLELKLDGEVSDNEGNSQDDIFNEEK